MVRPNSGLLAAMLRGNLLAGALRWKVTFTSELVAQESNMAGWTSAWIDLSGLTKLPQVTAEFARVLNFPDYFDGELSGLTSFLSDAVPPESGMVVAISGWQEFARLSAGEASQFAEALDAAVENLSAVIIFCDPSGKYAGLAELSLA